MALFEMDVLYTFLQWVCKWSLVQRIQLMLNGFKQCLGELIQHVSLSSMQHQKPKKEITFEGPEKQDSTLQHQKPNKKRNRRASKKLNKKRNMEIFEDRENDHTTSKHGKTNKEIFEDLKNDSNSEWGPLFRRSDKYQNLKIHFGRRIGKGSQAKVYEATGTARGGMTKMLAAKAFKSGYSLRDLQTQWPHGLAQWIKIALKQDFQRHKANKLNDYLCLPLGATVLEDDRFAFIFPRLGGDLRELIDIQLHDGGNSRRPFSPCYTFSILHKIAKGMEMLHSMGFFHTDLKAKNVLYPLIRDSLGKLNDCDQAYFINGLHIGDFESSVNNVGTGVWRAPEIVRQLKNPNMPRIFTRQADVYSFGMTCYEVLTGHNPACADGGQCENCAQCKDQALRDLAVQDFHEVYPGIGELLTRCWHGDARHRPTFAEIVKGLKSIGHTGECNYPHYGQYKQEKKHYGQAKVLRVHSAEKVGVKNTHNKNTSVKNIECPQILTRPGFCSQSAGAEKEDHPQTEEHVKPKRRKGRCAFTYQCTESESYPR